MTAKLNYFAFPIAVISNPLEKKEGATLQYISGSPFLDSVLKISEVLKILTQKNDTVLPTTILTELET